MILLYSQKLSNNPIFLYTVSAILAVVGFILLARSARTMAKINRQQYEDPNPSYDEYQRRNRKKLAAGIGVRIGLLILASTFFIILYAVTK